jgi:hypothetical protein
MMWRDVERRLKLKTRSFGDGSLHRLTQKAPRPQSERVPRKKRIFQGQGQIEMDWWVAPKLSDSATPVCYPLFLAIKIVNFLIIVISALREFLECPSSDSKLVHHRLR